MRPIGDLVIAGVAGLALCCPLLLPALQLSSNSVRTKYEPIDDVSTIHSLLGSANKPSEALALHDLTHLLFQSFDGFPVTGGALFSDSIDFHGFVRVCGCRCHRPCGARGGGTTKEEHGRDRFDGDDGVHVRSRLRPTGRLDCGPPTRRRVVPLEPSAHSVGIRTGGPGRLWSRRRGAAPRRASRAAMVRLRISRGWRGHRRALLVRPGHPAGCGGRDPRTQFHLAGCCCGRRAGPRRNTFVRLLEGADGTVGPLTKSGRSRDRRRPSRLRDRVPGRGRRPPLVVGFAIPCRPVPRNSRSREPSAPRSSGSENPSVPSLAPYSVSGRTSTTRTRCANSPSTTP